MAPLDTAEKMEAKAGEGQQRGPGPAAAPARPQLRAPGRGYDPFSCGVDNTEMARLSSMAMARCFSDILGDQRISVYLQSVTLDTFYSVVGSSKYCEPFCDL